MSREHQVMYELERKRREEIERQRAGEYVQSAYKRLCREFDRMLEQEYDAYVPDEMERIRQYIRDVEEQSLQDVFAARDTMRQALSVVSNMSYIVRCAKEEFQRQELVRYEQLQRQREEMKSRLLDFYYEKIASIRNPIVINFSVQDLNLLKESIEKGDVTSENDVELHIKQITGNAEASARIWKEEKQDKERMQILQSLIDSGITEVEEEKFENQKKKDQLIQQMRQLKKEVSAATREEDVSSRLRDIRKEMDSTLIDEKVRKETVRAIIKSLEKQDFTVSKPRIFGEGKDSYVLVKATRPSGKQVSCKINLEGKLNYRFDQYEGMTCLEDIAQFNVDLVKIYSINLSDERVIWENPDRISRTQSIAAEENRRNV